MKIAIGNDHRGLDAKARLRTLLEGMKHTVLDLGATTSASADYPDSAIAVSEAVVRGDADRGILICATGHGMCIAANKVAGIRAANCRDHIDAELSRSHNDTNVMCLSQDLVGDDLMERMVQTWLDTPFDGGRHARRLQKVAEYEQKRGK
jgi:ribose 5-phosphate isomerase B